MKTMTNVNNTPFIFSRNNCRLQIIIINYDECWLSEPNLKIYCVCFFWVFFFFLVLVHIRIIEHAEQEWKQFV